MRVIIKSKHVLLTTSNKTSTWKALLKLSVEIVSQNTQEWFLT